MRRRLCIMSETGGTVCYVSDDVAAKMLEVYDKSKEFQPVRIDVNTIVSVEKIPAYYPVCVTANGTVWRYSLDDSLAFAEALVNAVKYVKNFT